MQLEQYNAVNTCDSTEQFLALILINLVIYESEKELLSGLHELVEFKKSVNYMPFKAMSDEFLRIDYSTNDENISNKLHKKKKGWEEYNSELSYLNRIFINADTFCHRFNSIRRRQGIDSFQDKSPRTLLMIYFLEIAAVADYRLYSLITNPKNYFTVYRVEHS